MATVFDGDNLIITLNAGGAVHTVDVQVDLYSDWKEWVKLPGNSKYPQAFDTDGGAELVTGIKQGSYYFLRNDLGWRIRPSEEDANINFVGNLVARNATLPIIIPTIGAFTVLINGLQPITQNVSELLTEQRSAAYNGKVAIDTIGGVSGTGVGVGTATNPVNNLADAITIAVRESIEHFTLKGTIALTQAFTNWQFEGVSTADNSVVQLNGQNVGGSLFSGCEVQGAGSGDIQALRCHFDAVSGVSGHFDFCAFENNFTMGGNCSFHRCYSDVNGTVKPWISMNGGAYSVGFRGWIGGLDYRSSSNINAKTSIDSGGSMRLLIDSTCTNGEIIVGGVVELTDNSGVNCNVIDTSRMSPEKQQRILKATAYRQYTNPTTGNLDIYDDSDTLDQSVPIYEDDGTTSWDGVGPIRRRNKIT